MREPKGLVCVRGATVTCTFLYFLMVFLHVGQSLGRGDTSNKAHINSKMLMSSHKKGGGNDLEESTSRCKLEQE